MTQPAAQLFTGDAKSLAKIIPAGSLDAIVTSPPYWGLRKYGGEAGMIGLEPLFVDYVAHLVALFRELRRALTSAGSLWLNLGDLYSGSGGMRHAPEPGDRRRVKTGSERVESRGSVNLPPGCLVGLPWRVAFALVDDGWILRQSIVWAKPNPMPESVRNRCTRAHEFLFHFVKAPGYYWNHAAAQEPATCRRKPGRKIRDTRETHGTGGGNAGINHLMARYHIEGQPATRNPRDVWILPQTPYKGGHFATYPPDLVRPCIRATVPPEGLVLDPFAGAGTTLVVALEEGRHSIGFEINPEYIKIAAERIEKRRADLAHSSAAIGEV